jgi:hypothetical protein
MAITCNTSSHPIGNAGAALDEAAWRALCEKAETHASNGCGQSHGLYVDLLSAAIDEQIAQLPEHQQALALRIAQEWDYATPAERQEAQDWNAENGYCTHGIELGYCPAGCGS